MIQTKIRNFILNLYENKKRKHSHEPYCLYPENECTCKINQIIEDDTNLIKNGIIDSFNMTIVLIYVEDEFNIQIPLLDSIPEKFNSINNITNLVKI